MLSLGQSCHCFNFNTSLGKQSTRRFRGHTEASRHLTREQISETTLDAPRRKTLHAVSHVRYVSGVSHCIILCRNTSCTTSAARWKLSWTRRARSKDGDSASTILSWRCVWLWGPVAVLQLIVSMYCFEGHLWFCLFAIEFYSLDTPSTRNFSGHAETRRRLTSPVEQTSERTSRSKTVHVSPLN